MDAMCHNFTSTACCNIASPHWDHLSLHYARQCLRWILWTKGEWVCSKMCLQSSGEPQPCASCIVSRAHWRHYLLEMQVQVCGCGYTSRRKGKRALHWTLFMLNHTGAMFDQQLLLRLTRKPLIPPWYRPYRTWCRFRAQGTWPFWWSSAMILSKRMALMGMVQASDWMCSYNPWTHNRGMMIFWALSLCFVNAKVEPQWIQDKFKPAACLRRVMCLMNASESIRIHKGMEYQPLVWSEWAQ